MHVDQNFKIKIIKKKIIKVQHDNKFQTNKFLNNLSVNLTKLNRKILKIYKNLTEVLLRTKIKLINRIHQILIHLDQILIKNKWEIQIDKHLLVRIMQSLILLKQTTILQKTQKKSNNTTRKRL